MKRYERFICHICGKEISMAGGGINHFRKHVRDGLMREIRRGRWPNAWFEYVPTREGLSAMARVKNAE